MCFYKVFNSQNHIMKYLLALPHFMNEKTEIRAVYLCSQSQSVADRLDSGHLDSLPFHYTVLLM